MVLFGESLGAWTSQDAFAHRGTQGLLNAGVDRAIWIGTPYMSKWKEEVLGATGPTSTAAWSAGSTTSASSRRWTPRLAGSCALS